MTPLRKAVTFPRVSTSLRSCAATHCANVQPQKQSVKQLPVMLYPERMMFRWVGGHPHRRLKQQLDPSKFVRDCAEEQHGQKHE